MKVGEIRDVLLLEVVLPRTARLAAGERALVVPLASVHARMAREVARRRKRALARRADVFLFRRASSSCTTTTCTSCIARGGRAVTVLLLLLVRGLGRLGRHGLGRGGCAGERLRVGCGRSERGGVCGVCALSVLPILLLLLLDVAVVHLLLLLLLGGREVVHGRGRHRLVGRRVGHRVGPRVLGVVGFVDGLARHGGERVRGGRAGGVGCVGAAAATIGVRGCVVGVVEGGLASGGLP